MPSTMPDVVSGAETLGTGVHQSGWEDDGTHTKSEMAEDNGVQFFTVFFPRGDVVFNVSYFRDVGTLDIYC